MATTSYSSYSTTLLVLSTQYEQIRTLTRTTSRIETIPPYAGLGITPSQFDAITVVEFAVLVSVVLLTLRPTRPRRPAIAPEQTLPTKLETGITRGPQPSREHERKAETARSRTGRKDSFPRFKKWFPIFLVGSGLTLVINPKQSAVLPFDQLIEIYAGVLGIIAVILLVVDVANWSGSEEEYSSDGVVDREWYDEMQNEAERDDYPDDYDDADHGESG